MNLKNVCAVLLAITGIMDGMLLLDIVIAVMLLIFSFSTTCLCLQLYALHVLKIELTEDEMHVYDLMCYDDGELMLLKMDLQKILSITQFAKLKILSRKTPG